MSHPPVFERVFARLRYEPDGCWIYTGALGGHGYGQLKDRGRSVLAHRVTYAHLVGPIPEGTELDHLCRKPACVNPAHLEPVSHLENVRRGESGRRFRDQTACKNGHAFTQENTYRRSDGGRGCRVCRRARTHKHFLAHREQENQRCREYYRARRVR